MHVLACNRVMCSADHSISKLPGLQFASVGAAIGIAAVIIVACGSVIEVHHPHHPPT